MRTTVLQSIVVAVIVCGASACTADDDDGGEGEASEGEGEGEEPGPSTCALLCDEDADCFGGPCVDGGCETPPPTITPCNTDAECLGYANPFTWSTACVATSDCAETEACVDVNGITALCAPLAASSGFCDGGPTIDDVTGATVEVCGSMAVCLEGECRQCASDADCANDSFSIGPFCNQAGRCSVCLVDDHCGADAPRCVNESQCGCATDDDCAEFGGGTCDRFGQCFGCTDDADCEFFFSGSACLEGAICGCRDDSDCTNEGVEQVCR